MFLTIKFHVTNQHNKVMPNEQKIEGKRKYHSIWQVLNAENNLEQKYEVMERLFDLHALEAKREVVSGIYAMRKDYEYMDTKSACEKFSEHEGIDLNNSQTHLSEVLRAWNIKGSNPEYHDKIKENLSLHWPSLYKAIESLSKDNK